MKARSQIIKALLLALGLCLIAIPSHALDYPHTFHPSTLDYIVDCQDCHWVHGGVPWSTTYANPDETYNNNLCLDCHTGSPGTDEATHSSIQVDGSYRDWSIECTTCHDPHSHNQPDVYGSASYLDSGDSDLIANLNEITMTGAGWQADEFAGMMVIPDTSDPFYVYQITSNTTDTLTVNGPMVQRYGAPHLTIGNSYNFAIIYGRLVRSALRNAPDMDTCEVVANEFVCGTTTSPTVRHFNKTGDKSMADGDGIYDGVCEVCHNKTTYHRSDNIGATHNASADCADCHKHLEGFEVPASRCNSCHGFPPIVNTVGPPTGLADDPGNSGSTGSSFAGAHAIHVTTEGIGCGYCHLKSAGSGTTHNDLSPYTVTMGFSLFAGLFEGGTYKGQTGVSYDATSTSPVTDVSTQDDSLTCATIYCHSDVQRQSDGADIPDSYATPAWDGAVLCGDCHKADGVQGQGNLMDNIAHTPHTGYTNGGCTKCHDNTGLGDLHANGNIDVNFDDAVLPDGAYSQSPNHPGGGYGSCSNVQACHGTGTASTPNWGVDTFKCGQCHLGSADDVDDFVFDNGTLANINDNEWGHSGHGRTSSTYDASGNPAANLPGAAGAGDQCQYCHDKSITHGDSNNPFRLKDHALGNGWNDVCLICHASSQSGYDPPGVEALKTATKKINKWHDGDKHASSTNDGGMLCFDCHDPHGDRKSTPSGNIMMIQRAVTVDKADVYGTPLTTKSPDFIDRIKVDPPDGYNSFAKEAPDFGTSGDYVGICQVCHEQQTDYHRNNSSYGKPQDHNEGLTCTTSACHEHSITSTIDNLAFAKPSDDSCSSCHSDSGGPAGSDSGHNAHVQTPYIGSLSDGDYGNYGTNNWYYFDNTSGTPDMGCGYCHPRDLSVHNNGSKNLGFDPTDTGAAGTLKALYDPVENYAQTPGVSVTCSSTYCHSTGYINPGTGKYVYVDSPDWYGGTFAGIAEDRCAGCHGNSPNSTDATAGQRVGSLSHYNPDFTGTGEEGGHFVSIHYNNIYDDDGAGLVENPASTLNAHGDASNLSTIINCDTCHYDTVVDSFNDQNTVCKTCHDDATASFRGDLDIKAGSTTHIDGRLMLPLNPVSLLYQGRR